MRKAFWINKGLSESEAIIKIKLAESHGYQVLIITELDYRRDPETILNTCLQFIRE